MPSKSNRKTKPPSQSPSQTPSTPLTNHEELNPSSSIILEASRRFPSFISTQSTLVSRVSGFDSSPSQKGFTIWLPESSFLSSSFSPASLVSISLPSVDSTSTSGFPLTWLAIECSEQFGLESQNIEDRPGNYFVLATAFHSNKLQKNEVRISSSLSYSLGGPTIGTTIFVHPINGGSRTSLMDGYGNLPNPTVNHLPIHHCKELFIRLLPSKQGYEMSLAPSKTGPDKTPYRYNSNGKPPSPSTPVSKTSRPCSPNTSARSSMTSEDSSVKNPSHSSRVVVEEVLRDENARKLLERSSVSWLNSRVLLRGNLVTIPVLSQLCFFEVVGPTKLSGDDINEGFVVGNATKIQICLGSDIASEMRSVTGDVKVGLGDEVEKFKDLSYENKEKLWKEYRVLKDLISSSVNNSLSSLGLRATKGALLHGPPGTGKTLLAQLCSLDAGVHLFKVNGPEIVGQYYGESEKALHDVFKSATESSPSVIFIDELDAIAPARKEGGEELSQRMVATLLNLMDGISRTDGLLIIAATNRIDCIEHALRRPGRLDREIEIGVPSADQRFNILENLLNRMAHSLTKEQVSQLSRVTHGFVGADLEALKNEAAMSCLRRYVTSCEGTSDMFSDDDDADVASSPNVGSAASSGPMSSHLKVTFEDFELARVKIRPSAMREVILEVPNIDWTDVGGQHEVKAQLMEAVEWPQKHRSAFERIGTRPPTGILMFGPPGCSKTLMARAVASKAGLNFLAVKGPELFSKWVGESEKAIRSLFAKARANAPSVIFFDEIDSVGGARGREKDGVSVGDRVVNQLLVELDGLHERVNVTVIAATNCPENIDPALLRPGRFDRLLYVGPPNETDRIDIFRVHLRKMPCNSDVDLKELAKLTEGCTGADISSICREAAISAIEEDFDASEIRMEHLKNVALNVRPSEIRSYRDLPAKFQRLVHSKTRSDDSECQVQLIEPKEISSWNPVKWTVHLAHRLTTALSLKNTSS